MIVKYLDWLYELIDIMLIIDDLNSIKFNNYSPTLLIF